MTWQAAAAWVGAALGIINFVGAVLSRRPAFVLRPCKRRLGAAGPPALITVTASSRPVFLRSLHFWPRQVGEDKAYLDDGGGPNGMVSIIDWALNKRFAFFIEAGQSRTFRIEALNGHAWRLVIIRWADDRWQPFPWHLRILRSTQLAAFNEALATDEGNASLDERRHG